MLTLFFAYLLSSAHAQVRFAPVEGQFQVKAEFDYLYSTANYLPNSTTLNAGGKYTRMLGVGEASYDFSPALRVWGGIDGGQAATTSIDYTNLTVNTTNTVGRTNAGINELYLGGQWWTEFKMFDIVPQVDFYYPFWRVDETSNNPLLGDGALRFQAGTWVMLPTDKFTPLGYLGLAFQDGGRPIQLPYSVGARIGSANTFFVQAEFKGYASLNNDTNTDNSAIRDVYLSRVDGGSYAFYALNPNQSEIAATAGFNYQGFGVYAAVAKTIFGKNSADQWNTSIGVTYTGSTKPKPNHVDSYFRHERESKDNADQRLFQEQVVPPTSDPDAERVMDPPPEIRQKPPEPPKKKVQRSAPAKDAPMPNVELLMKDTQKSLEKKKGHDQ